MLIELKEVDGQKLKLKILEKLQIIIIRDDL